MPSSPFSLLPRRPALLRWFARNNVQEDAFIQLNNLLAQSADVRQITESDVGRICAEYGTTVEQLIQRGKLYRDYLAHCLTDRQLSDAELDDLAHLRNLLRLDAGTTDLIHRRVARQVYTRTVDEVLADERVDESERNFLARLRDELGIPGGVADNIEAMRNLQREARKQIVSNKGRSTKDRSR
jgi:hypothetical protein